MLKYIIVFLCSLGLSSLLLSIEWFTWQAWLFVTAYMVIQYWYQMCRSSDQYTTNQNLGNKLNAMQKSVLRFNESMENLNGLMLDSFSKINKELEKIRKILIHESK